MVAIDGSFAYTSMLEKVSAKLAIPNPKELTFGEKLMWKPVNRGVLHELTVSLKYVQDLETVRSFAWLDRFGAYVVMLLSR